MAINISYPTSASGIIVLVKILNKYFADFADFADFAWLEQPEGNLMDAISRVWYNGSYTIAPTPIKTLEINVRALIGQSAMVYLVNKPLRVAGMSADMSAAERLSEK